MKAIITGGNGFIGKQLQEGFKSNNIDFDLFNGDITKKITTSKPYDLLVHLAAKLKPDIGIFSVYEANVLGTQRIVDYCIQNRVNLIFLSTSGVYGEENPEYPKSEDSECLPVNAYPISKLLAERLCANAFSGSGLSCTILRLFNVYGSNQREKFLIPDIIKAIKNSSELFLKTPNALRDFVNVKDVVRSIIASIDLKGFNTINIGSGQLISLSDLIRRIEFLIGRNLDINLETVSHLQSVGIVADISKANEILHWKPEISLDQGLKEILISEKII
ncbi:NAD-dependent epimerase/dehydratase family protein [Leptospira levettii]|uniref:NAD(P)-dependent oxidoreductase n=1 Tax=Leptospira levettii TaxID=2023178 RepID=A0AAW5V3M3_9LEPT|nr:NAD(P)-dependent oxidoreductase [Leptospira levettii]MCW7466217.1 NAD(P)-dependent oxidoreductase [Leptospira levettii]MCW7512258.1 NAD(P)-dependent oxidoreductase [Leptospira levettii]MCW7516266.1 NAD(P)-dependent oxidoreductase [Leptospira levettii]